MTITTKHLMGRGAISAVSRWAITIFVLLAMSATMAQAQIPAPETHFSLASGSGGQVAIGNGLPLPIQVIPGGQGTGMVLPPLLVGRAMTGTTIGTAWSDGVNGTVFVPPGALTNVPTTTAKQPTLASNPAVFQVNTAIDYAWPSPTRGATFSPGGSPVGQLGGATTIFVGTGPAGGTVTYSNANGATAFGGAASWALTPNPLSAGGRILGSPVTVYINFMGQLPSTATTAAIVGATLDFAAWGNPVTVPTATSAAPRADPGFVTGPAGGMVGGGGTVLNTVACTSPCPGIPNNVLGDKGFPWTTGAAVLSAPNAAPAEIFVISGTDTRVGGAGPGNIQMVTGTVSNRAASGPNANRGWVNLNLVVEPTPEPAAILGLTGAFAMLGLCHTIARRRSR